MKHAEKDEEEKKEGRPPTNVVFNILFGLSTNLRHDIHIQFFLRDSMWNTYACWYTHISMKNMNIFPDRIERLRVQPVGIIVTSAVMATLVLGNFVSALNNYVADRYSSYYSVSDYHVYEFCKIWNCSRDEVTIAV